jgi:hypothetical protein
MAGKGSDSSADWFTANPGRETVDTTRKAARQIEQRRSKYRFKREPSFVDGEFRAGISASGILSNNLAQKRKFRNAKRKRAAERLFFFENITYQTPDW